MGGIISLTKVRALQLSFIAILSVVFFEFAVGMITNSLAILSDAAHALFDSTTTLILLVTTKLSLKPPDEEHLYGHGKIEPIGGLIGGIVLFGLSAFLVTQAGTRLIATVEVNPETTGFWAIGYTLAVDFFRIAILRSHVEASLTVKANLYHAFSDFGSTVIAMLGFGLAFVGIDQGDPFASIVLGVLLAYLSVRLIYGSGSELSDAISRKVVEEVRKEILGTTGVSVCKELKVRKVGTKIYVETSICVPSSMTLEGAHRVASQIESNILNLCNDATTTVHIEPEGEGRPVGKQVEEAAARVEGVKSVHNMSNVYSGGKLHITLHAMVEPRLSLKEAHDISENIEKNLKQQVHDVETVTVHIEPYAPRLRQEFMIEDRQVERMVRRIVAEHPNIGGVERVVTYMSEKRRYINVHCSFGKDISVDMMHNTISQLESEIKKEFKEAVVTIHAEPST